ncbi:MAG: UDP-N-acetylmuramyl pentapeptide phosphotransferase/UDP-N-acetylglucosamine-phosphate transferase [Acidimicrobiales bacterium]|nr:UDP-N-acetylmuramyl pentapeptide phosphotransferase/UDP-N-acetylglucosamine-phosphate transferase [Acidimicrobiales bacterium]
MFGLPALARQNYRGVTVATAAGVVVPFTALLVEAGRDVAASFDVGHELTTARALVLLTAAAFGFLGLLDDVVGSGHAQGFRGHLRELGHGRLTTGGVKLVGGAAAALAVASAVDGASPGRLLADAALVALAANLANQLDRRPGRVAKVGVAGFVVLTVATDAQRSLQGVAVVVGATAALVVEDLRERLMLGDVGANVLGACLGLGVVLGCSFNVRLVTLVVVLLLNLVGEVSSFTRIIESFPPLRAIDRAGRRDP